MKMFPILLGLILILPVAARAQDADCQQFDALVARVYDFDEAKMSDAQKNEKERDLDRFWKRVKADKAKFLPCLRLKIADPKANAFLRFDGSNLLVSLDPSPDSMRAQIAVYLATPLDIIGVNRWVSILTLRGTQGFDVSSAARRALDDESIFYVTEAGELIPHFDAALLLYASQDEAAVTPQLFALANDPNYAERETALSILMQQATPQSLEFVAKINRDGLSPEAINALESLPQMSQQILPRAQPQATRAQYLRAFENIVKGDPRAFNSLLRADDEGERDVVALFTPADLPLLRRVRRQFLLGGGESSLSFYRDFTKVIFALMKK